MSLIAHHLGQLDEVSTPGETRPTQVAEAAGRTSGAGSALGEAEPPRGGLGRSLGLEALIK